MSRPIPDSVETRECRRIAHYWQVICGACGQPAATAIEKHEGKFPNFLRLSLVSRTDTKRRYRIGEPMPPMTCACAHRVRAAATATDGLR